MEPFLEEENRTRPHIMDSSDYVVAVNETELENELPENQDAVTMMSILIVGTFLSLLIFLSVAGNILVCVAIYTDRGLRRIGNLFLASLAIADLFVASLVMTFAGVNDILGYWIFGAQFCDTWVAFDVMCSTIWKVGDKTSGFRNNSNNMASGSAYFVRSHFPGFAQASSAPRLQRWRPKLSNVRSRSHSDLCRCLKLHLLLRSLHCHDRNLLPSLLLCSKTRKKHPRYYAPHRPPRHQHQKEHETEKQSPPHPPSQSSQFTVPRERSQSRHHRGHHHGCVPHLLGAVLLHQHRGRLLQDLHPGHHVQDFDLVGVFKFRFQSHYLLHFQYGISGGV